MPSISLSVASDRNHELALHHATLLQQRKDVESDILSALEELIDFPTDPRVLVSRPAPADLAHFNKLTAPFQISDYNALIEERNAAGKCGYVFCSKPLKLDPAISGNYSRIVRTSGKNGELKVVPSNKVEMWCSKWCSRRAVYIKHQLSEVPAWERAATQANQVQILDEVAGFKGLREKMERMSLENGREQEVQEALAELALERGERSERPIMMQNMTLREKTLLTAPRAPQLGDPLNASSQHAQIEGYAPSTAAPRLTLPVSSDNDDDDDEEVDTDWPIG